MSLLLDALNKADQDRKRSTESPNISSNHDAQFSHAAAKPLNKILLITVGILLVLLLTAVYWLGKKNQQTSVEKNNLATSTQQPTQKTESTAAKPSVIHLGDAVTTDNATSTNNNEETVSLPAKTATELADDESIATLYHQQANNTVPIPKSTITEAESNQQIITNSTPAVPASPMSITQFANIPDIQDLPSNVLQRIPSLKYSEHNYNSNGGSVVINGAIKHTNDQLSEGLVIDKILEDGMILHFENYSFKMRAMNTWLNM